MRPKQIFPTPQPIIKSLLKTATQQLFPVAKPAVTKQLIFSNKAVERMKKHALSEKDIEDVWLHGQRLAGNLLVRKYRWYEIGLVYAADFHQGHYIVCSVWKRERR